MNARERTLAAVAGLAVDRPPAGFWGHDFLREWSVEGLAAATVEAAQSFGYDFVKVNPRATHYAEAWGCRYRADSDGNGSPEPLAWVVSQVEDLVSLKAVDGTTGPFGAQLEALKMIRGQLGDLPLVQTVFSPLSVLGRLANDRRLVRSWLDDHPDEVRVALAAIAATLANYARASLDAGADGIFFATTEWATRDVLTTNHYAVFGRPYDLRVLVGASGAPMNVLHICRSNNLLADLVDYPVSVINWAQHAPGNLSLKEAMSFTNKALMGGIDERNALRHGPPDYVREQVAEALQQTRGQRFLLAPGCSIDPATPPENIRAALNALSPV